MFSIPNFQQIQQLIIQEIRNGTGATVPADSDASLRAAGTAAAVEGVYQHQNYIQRQLFAQTADEPYLYIHAEEVGVPRAASNRASGSVEALSNAAIALDVGQKLTDGKGHFYSVVSAINMIAHEPAIIVIEADQPGANWNFSGTDLIWVSPVAGLQSTASVITLGGGTDVEDLESWRERIIQAKQQGKQRDRAEDVKRDLKEVPGIRHIYVYPKRRGIGSLDVAITAAGNPPALASPELIAAAQLVLNRTAGFWADCRIYNPTIQNTDVTALISGSADLESVRQVIRDYFSELEPGQAYLEAVLSARCLNVNGVTDVVLSPSANIIPAVNWMHTHWLRLGVLDVRAAS